MTLDEKTTPNSVIEWPCPECDYDLRASFDAQRLHACCPECSKTSTRQDILKHMEKRGPNRFTFLSISKYGMSIVTAPFLVVLLFSTGSLTATLIIAMFLSVGCSFMYCVTTSLPGHKRFLYIAIHTAIFMLLNIVVLFLTMLVLLSVFSMYADV